VTPAQLLHNKLVQDQLGAILSEMGSIKQDIHKTIVNFVNTLNSDESVDGLQPAVEAYRQLHYMERALVPVYSDDWNYDVHDLSILPVMLELQGNLQVGVATVKDAHALVAALTEKGFIKAKDAPAPGADDKPDDAIPFEDAVNEAGAASVVTDEKTDKPKDS
jgi:hypothetical protein